MHIDAYLTNLARRDWLINGPLNDYITTYIESLRCQRYPKRTIRAYLGCLAHFSHWPPTSWCDRRDRIMFELLYNTGARVSEMLGIRVADITLAATSSVRLQGKGCKQRTVPLWKKTAADIRCWLDYAGLRPDQPLVPNP